jgi:hypothetical protein
MERASGIKVLTNKDYFKEHLQFSEDEVAIILTEEVWAVPSPESDFWISQIGPSKHRGVATGVHIGSERFGIFVKPRSLREARLEASSSEKARLRKVNTPPVVAIVSYPDNALLVTHLQQNAIPLSGLNLTFSGVDSRAYRPERFLKSTLEAVAGMHNSGVVHNDLYLGNIGIQYHEEAREEVIFFDFEDANILGDNLLYKRYQRQTRLSAKEKATLERFESMAMEDLVYLLANFNFRNGFPMTNEDLIDKAMEVYPAFRHPSYGVKDESDFRRALPDIYWNTVIHIDDSIKNSKVDIAS